MSKAKIYFQEFFSKETAVDEWEEIYNEDSFMGICLRERMNLALSWLDTSNLSKNSNILDAGCGAGIVTQKVAEKGYRVLGMDFSRNMLERTANICNTGRGSNVFLLQGDTESLPFADSSFDMILCLGVVAYLESPEKALDELRRVLKPYGVLILNIINKACLARKLDVPLLLKHQLQRKLIAKVPPWIYRPERKASPGQKTFLIPHFSHLLKKHGFDVLEYKTIPLELIKIYGRIIPPKRINAKIAMLFDKSANIPIVGSFGGMCMFKAKKTDHVTS